VDAMLASLPGMLFVEWMAYAEIEPFGEERADLRMAIGTAAIANIIYQLWTGKRDAPFKVEDFVPRFEKREPISKEDAIAAIDAAMMMFVNATNPPAAKAASPQMVEPNLGRADIE
jgi:hypothetical protein